MDREYLKDYEEKEWNEYQKLVKRTLEGKLSFGRDVFPDDGRFVKLQKPVGFASHETPICRNLWSQIPFCGSLILSLNPFAKAEFEELYFEVAEIPKIIDFIKETGRLQIVLGALPTQFKGLDHFDLFFQELRPPLMMAAPPFFFSNEKEFEKAQVSFMTLAQIKYLDFLTTEYGYLGDFPQIYLGLDMDTYAVLKLGNYQFVEEVEDLIVDEPLHARIFLDICRRFITDPLRDLRIDQRNFTLAEIKTSKVIPRAYRPTEMRFPCEIGEFLLRKLTYAAQNLRACYELMDHYDPFDLRKVQQSLNEGIVTSHPDIVTKSTEEFSEILDNVWNDKTIPNKIKDIEIGVPVSIAAVGGIAGALVAGPAGAGLGGFLAGLGFKVGEKAMEKFHAVKGDGLSENLAKFRTKSYQANIYDFKKKYNK